MIARWTARLRSWRRRASRNEWLVRWLGLPRYSGAAEHGLLLVQIDGLSRTQFEAALRAKRMPFLASLLKHERYRVHSFYSGLPSSTPGVQGELFYGVGTAVPAFSFRRRDDGQVVRMYDGPAAADKQQQLEQLGDGLLAGGSAYCDIYTGGAVQSHFCPATMGWNELLAAANPLALLGAAVWNGWSLVRTAALTLIEIVLALVDFARGVVHQEDLWTELKFVPMRVAVCIGLRELIVIGASIDATRGLPVIHLNLLGYDEQAHRRGPSSRFAHWTLSGIDYAIRRVVGAARRSACRDYDVWVYSDHGQEATRPYEVLNGESIHQAVARVFDQDLHATVRQGRGEQFTRAHWLGGHWLARWMPWPLADSGPQNKVTLAAMGPLAHVYPDQLLSERERLARARALVAEAHVPVVYVAAEHGMAVAYTAQGEFRLPQQAAELFGDDHPFLAEVTRDMLSLVHHPDAGPFVLGGWWRGVATAVSFPMENGAHAGPGPEETRAFALLPGDAPLPAGSSYLRPLDLRAAALHHLGRAPHPDPSFRAPPTTRPRTLRILTYNVHSCIGMDGKLSPSRIARVIAQCEPDIVALQELDVRRMRTGGRDQAEEIARELKMEFHFHPALRLEEELYGDAVLSRYPMRLVRAASLPGLPSKPKLEPRGALWVAIDLGEGDELHLLNTHLGLLARERRRQVDELLGPNWLGHHACCEPMVLCGDFNALPGTQAYRRLAARLCDAQTNLDGHLAQHTWFSGYPLGRIDHVFVSNNVSVQRVEVLRTHLARIASDHLPLVVEVRLPEG